MIRSFLLLAMFCFAWVLDQRFIHADVPASSPLPNILVVLCDDLGWGDLSCYGHPVIQTKNLDAFASQGARLTSCYSAAPVCSPSRVGLLTGRSPNRAGIFDWIPEVKPDSPRNSKDSRHLVHMRSTESTIPQMLKKAGYATAMAGKWHCNSMFNSSEQPQPNDAGFDHWFATQNNAAPSHQNPNNFVQNGTAVGVKTGFSCQIVADEMIGWMEKHHRDNPKQPFFAYVAFHEPHEPVRSPESLVAQYRSVAKNEDQAQYFANVHNMDEAFGKLMKSLDSMGIAQKTLVFFSSDNGPETLNRYPAARRSHGSPGPLRGMKLWTTEAGFRVPGLIRFPGRIGPDQTLDTPMSSLDLMPTCLSLTGLASVDRELDGCAWSPLFEGQPIVRTKPLFWFYYNAINDQRAAMRSGKWKLLAKFNSGSLQKVENIADANAEAYRTATLTDFELYDMEKDIGESNDVGASHPQVLEEMKAKMQDLYREVASSMHVWP